VLLFRATRTKSVVISLCSSEQSAINIFQAYKKTGTCDPKESEFWIPHMTLHSVRLDNLQDDILHCKDAKRLNDNLYANQQKLIWAQKRAALLGNKASTSSSSSSSSASTSIESAQQQRVLKEAALIREARGIKAIDKPYPKAKPITNHFQPVSGVKRKHESE
jgi:hypothetical protein